MNSVRGLASRRVSALSAERLHLPRTLRNSLARGSERLHRMGTSMSAGVRGAVIVVLFVVTVGGAFAVGYTITHNNDGRHVSTDRAHDRAGSDENTGERVTDTTSPAVPISSPFTRLAEGCRTLPAGAVAPYLTPSSVLNDTAVDPRTKVATRRLGITTAQPIAPTQGKPPFSITAVILPTGSASAKAGPLIDRAGTVQLWIFFDGTALHKGIRIANGRSWTMADETDPASSAMTIVLGDGGASFYWPGIPSNGRVGFVTSDSGGCAVRSVSATAQPIDPLVP